MASISVNIGNLALEWATGKKNKKIFQRLYTLSKQNKPITDLCSNY